MKIDDIVVGEHYALDYGGGRFRVDAIETREEPMGYNRTRKIRVAAGYPVDRETGEVPEGQRLLHRSARSITGLWVDYAVEVAERTAAQAADEATRVAVVAALTAAGINAVVDPQWRNTSLHRHFGEGVRVHLSNEQARRLVEVLT